MESFRGLNEILHNNAKFGQVAKYSSTHFIEKKEVIARIEALCLLFIQELTTNSVVRSFQWILQDKSNSIETESNIRLGRRETRRTFFHNPVGYTQVWLVLSLLHNLLVSDQRATQRDIYYCLVRSFSNQTQFNAILRDITGIVKVPRVCLGVLCTAKGLLAGKIQVQMKDSTSWIDCQKQTVLIPGDPAAVSQMTTQARYILIVEKDAIFRRLVEDKIWEQLPLILVTGVGFPDMSSRILVKRLQLQTGLPTVGLFDFNIGGAGVMLCWKHGSITSGLESHLYSLDLHWLGILSSDVEKLDFPEQFRQPCKEIDKRRLDTVINDLRNYSSGQMAAIREELQKMKKINCKIEIEALYHYGINTMIDI